MCKGREHASPGSQCPLRFGTSGSVYDPMTVAVRKPKHTRVPPNSTAKHDRPSHSLRSFPLPASFLPQYCEEQGADAVSRVHHLGAVSPLCVRTASAKRKQLSPGDTGRNCPKVFGGLHLSKGLHEPFFGHGKIISLVVNFYPVKQHVFPARFCSSLAQANGA